MNCLKATKPPTGYNLPFTTKSPGVPGTHFIDPRGMKRLRRSWSHLVVLNPGHVDYGSSALTTRPLLHKPTYT